MTQRCYPRWSWFMRSQCHVTIPWKNIRDQRMIATHVPKPTFYWSSKIQYHQEKLIEIEHEQERVKSELLKLNEKWNSRHHQLQEARKASINPKGKFVHVEENPRVLSKEGP